MRRTCLLCCLLAIASFPIPSTSAFAQFTPGRVTYIPITLPAATNDTLGPYLSGDPAVADFNEDGHPDIVITAPGNDNLYDFAVLLGDGKGAFTQQPFVLPPDPCPAGTRCGGGRVGQVYVGDFNGDGHADILLYQGRDARTYALLYPGTGHGTFGQPVDVSKYIPGGLLIADLRGNGVLDLISSDFRLSSTGLAETVGPVTVALGNGDGTFRDPVQYGVTTTNIGAGVLLAGDLGNGHTDLIFGLGAYSNFSYQVLMGNGDGTFQPPKIISSYMGDALAPLGTGRVTGMVQGYYNWLQVANGNGDGTFAPFVSYPITVPYESPEVQSVRVGDLNGDGIEDIAFVAAGNGWYVGWSLGKADGTFAAPVAISQTHIFTPIQWNLTLASLTDSGRTDLVGYNCGNYCQLIIYWNAATTATLTSSANPDIFSSSITVTATVTGSVLNDGSPLSPPGGVYFYDNGKLLGGRPVKGGQATFANLVLPVGTHDLTVTYTGDYYYLGSTSAPLQQIVNGIPTAISLISSANPINHNSSVTFAATITAPVGGKQPTSASGIGVYFYNGDKLIGARPVDASGTASITTKFRAGTHQITVKYLGDSYWAPSTSNLVTEKVN